MRKLEKKLTSEYDYVYRCFCPYCGEMHAYYHGDKPPERGDPVLARNITEKDGSPAVAMELPKHISECKVFDWGIHGGISIFNTSNMERVQ